MCGMPSMVSWTRKGLRYFNWNSFMLYFFPNVCGAFRENSTHQTWNVKFLRVQYGSSNQSREQSNQNMNFWAGIAPAGIVHLTKHFSAFGCTPSIYRHVWMLRQSSLGAKSLRHASSSSLRWPETLKSNVKIAHKYQKGVRNSRRRTLCVVSAQILQNWIFSESLWPIAAINLLSRVITR